MSFDGESYIMDMGRALWKILFPFFYWIFPNPVYKVNEDEFKGTGSASRLLNPEKQSYRDSGGRSGRMSHSLTSWQSSLESRERIDRRERVFLFLCRFLYDSYFSTWYSPGLKFVMMVDVVNDCIIFHKEELRVQKGFFSCI